MEKNRFSVLLVQLINTAEGKHSFLAQELCFDVSYISKWVNGRALPSEKNIEDTIDRVSTTLVRHASPNGLKQLYRDYRVTREDELQAAIYQNLIAEYYYVVETQQEQGSVVERKVSFYPWLSIGGFLNKMRKEIGKRLRQSGRNRPAAYCYGIGRCHLQTIPSDPGRKETVHDPDDSRNVFGQDHLRTLV